MTSDKKEKLQMALVGIQRRWGNTAIDLVKRRPPAVPHVSTGFPALDEALGIGGIPRGRISEIVGGPTSGTSTLALKIIAHAQAQKGAAVYVDLEQTFDPDYADRCGVDLRRLILVHPYDGRQALAMLPDFVIHGGLEVLVVDVPSRLQTEPRTLRALSTTLGRLIAPLSKTTCALLFLTLLPPGQSPSAADYPSGATLPHYATVRLFLQRERWSYKRRDVSGYEARVFIAKNKFAAAERTAHIAITFNGVVAREKS